MEAIFIKDSVWQIISVIGIIGAFTSIVEGYFYDKYIKIHHKNNFKKRSDRISILEDEDLVDFHLKDQQKNPYQQYFNKITSIYFKSNYAVVFFVLFLVFFPGFCLFLDNFAGWAFKDNFSPFLENNLTLIFVYAVSVIAMIKVISICFMYYYSTKLSPSKNWIN